MRAAKETSGVLILLKFLGAAAIVVTIAIVLARAIFPVRKGIVRADSIALPPAHTGRLAEAVTAQKSEHPGKSGLLLLQEGADAFAARMILADQATISIDVQYYIWRRDLTGYLMLDALWRAADRGVRVRLLLDDNGIPGLDPELATLDAHPNVEVRLYNPFNLRRFKVLSYGFDFFRLNRRMHNKSFTVDGLVTILGGRNIGDEYFGTGPTASFVDLDVLAAGAIVPHVSADFDRYWAAPSVHTAGSILGALTVTDPIAGGLARYRAAPQLAEYRQVLERSMFVKALISGDLGLEWSTAILISDDPIKGEGAVRRKDLLASRLIKAVGEIRSRFDVVSPYLVPGAAGTRAFATLQSRGVAVRMLTNSLEATDVVPVHAGYTKRRKDMLRAGITLYELMAQSGRERSHPKFGPFGSFGASLHAKTFAVDGARIFVGSFNFDPRSATLNTEMGLLIESETMARGLHTAFDQELEGLAWRVERRHHHFVWKNPVDGTWTIREPGATPIKRIVLVVVGWLPVEWLL